MSRKPEAMLCAEALEAARDDPMWANHAEITKEACARSAAELRRLYAQRQSLLEALKTLPQSLASTDEDMDRWLVKARAAIAKAEGEKA